MAPAGTPDAPMFGEPDEAESQPAVSMDPRQLRRLIWWTTAGVAYGVGAFLLVAIAVTERSVPVATVAAGATAGSTLAAGQLLARQLPPGSVPATTSGAVVATWVAVASLGAIIAVAAAQWSETAMGALVPGVALGAVTVTVSPRWRKTVLGTGVLVAMVVVAGARWLAVGSLDTSAVANQGILVLAVGGALVVVLWFWTLVHRLERARRLEAQIAVADERLRFAAELHDIQGQHLQVIALRSELAARLADSDAEAASAEMVQVHEHARTALADTREVVHGYRQTSLHDELVNATRVLEAAGIDARLTDDVSATGMLDAEGRQLLGLVVREATTNILRHSHAGLAQIDLTGDRYWAQLSVRNDGPSMTGTTPAGSGLDDLARRLVGTGGRLDWGVDGDWFTVTAHLPVDRQ